MDTPAIDRRLLEPEGGSLNDSFIDGNDFVKTYDGDLERGYEKLRLEREFLDDLPPEVAARFARVNSFRDDPAIPRIELRVERVRHPALAKAVLNGLVDPAQLSDVLSQIFRFLITDLYPLRSGEISGLDLYQRYHGARMTRAIGLLIEHPEIRPLVNAPGVLVNGHPCPSTMAIVRWLDDHARELFPETHRLVAAHGDTHLDNVMFVTEGAAAPSFRLVDPRGESLLPPHYDLAKMLKALRTGYDLVHYDHYRIDVRLKAPAPSVSLRIESTFEEHYRAGMAVLLEALSAFSEAEGISKEAFIRALLVGEIAHIISFASYHLHRPKGGDVRRVLAYLATAALLAQDLMMADLPDLTSPLPIWEMTA